MNKLILSLGLLAAFSAPAAAGRLDIDPTVLKTLSLTQAQDRQAGVDYSATRSIGPSAGSSATTSANDSAGLRLQGSDKQRGNQGEFFGANGR